MEVASPDSAHPREGEGVFYSAAEEHAAVYRLGAMIHNHNYSLFLRGARQVPAYGVEEQDRLLNEPTEQADVRD